MAVRHLALVHSRAIPLTRGECVGGPRPCQFDRCRYHIDSDIESCVLDAADKGGLGPSVVGDILGMSRQRVMQIEDEAIAKLKGNAKTRRNLKQFADP